jgi:hypothetical protein
MSLRTTFFLHLSSDKLIICWLRVRGNICSCDYRQCLKFVSAGKANSCMYLYSRRSAQGTKFLQIEGPLRFTHNEISFVIGLACLDVCSVHNLLKLTSNFQTSNALYIYTVMLI